MPCFEHDGLRFNYSDTGADLPLVFQHGLGTDLRAILNLFQLPLGFRLLSMDFRAHGETRPLGPPEKICMSAFADDLAAFMDRLGIAQAVVGGSSMGAAVSLNLALRLPARVRGLILLRPCWLDQPLPPNARIFPVIARFIRQYGAREGRSHFARSEEYQSLFRQWPHATPSLLGLFDCPRAEDAVIRFDRIAQDAPCQSLKELSAVRVPTLVLVNPDDPVHPSGYGPTLAAAIPGAKLQELPPKSDPRHAPEMQRRISGFLKTISH